MSRKYTTEEYNQTLTNINSPLRVAPGENYIDMNTPIKHISIVTGKIFKTCPRYIVRSRDKLIESWIGKGSNHKKTTEEYKQELVDKGLTCTLAPGEEYVDSTVKLWHICSCGTSFLRRPSCVLDKHADKCLVCSKKIANEQAALTRTYSHQEFLEVLNQINPNIRIAQGQIYKGSHAKLLFYCCKCATLTLTSLRDIVAHGNVFCKKCRKKSLGEQIIAQYLEDNDMFYDPEHRFNDCRDVRPLPFDFWVNNSFIIEYDGGFHRKDVYGRLKKQHEHDKIKNDYCIFYEIPLIRIRESEYAKLDQMQRDIIERLKHGISKLQWGDKIIIRV